MRMLFPRGLLYRPHSLCKEEWAFVYVHPQPACRVRGAGRLSRPVAHPLSDNRATTAEGWARLSLMVGLEFSSTVGIGLRTFRGPSANAGWAVWRIDSRNVRYPSFLETLQLNRLLASRLRRRIYNYGHAVAAVDRPIPLSWLAYR